MSPFDSVPRTPQGLRMLLGAFRGGNPLERVVAVPSLWPRPGGVLQQHWLGFSRKVDSEQAHFRLARHQLIMHVSGFGRLTPKYQIGFVASDRISNRHAKSA